MAVVEFPPIYRDVAAMLGAYLVLDDIDDLGEFDRIHHWQIGAAMLLASLLPPPLIKVEEP